MAVPILAVAFSVYILGISVVLFIRPKLMFRPGGTWKEFGVGRGENYTVIPFWLFAIFWAFISYGVGLVVMSLFANMAMSAFPEQPPAPTMMPVSAMPVSQMPSPQPTMTQMMPPQPPQQMMPQPAPGPAPQTFMKPVSSLIGIPSNQPGFYVLQNNGGPGGPPQYVYYGTSPPPLPR